MGTGETLRERDDPAGTGGGSSREQVGLTGKELCGKGTPHAGGDSGTDSLGDKWSAVCSEHMLTLRPAPTGHHVTQHRNFCTTSHTWGIPRREKGLGRRHLPCPV